MVSNVAPNDQYLDENVVNKTLEFPLAMILKRTRANDCLDLQYCNYEHFEVILLHAARMHRFGHACNEEQTSSSNVLSSLPDLCSRVGTLVRKVRRRQPAPVAGLRPHEPYNSILLCTKSLLCGLVWDMRAAIGSS